MTDIIIVDARAIAKARAAPKNHKDAIGTEEISFYF
jgi:hypothetical protein